ncbi:MAG: hypothetical protein M9953_04410 [Thermomicrobiales bacterium]|nr:hypothetical protein [Thermomicrobiales bacterium]MCO5224558.1 hypothetical protein [Thermomicrobiales bacterium]MCO5227320.1 hypothetical protein [Thermomicrobiales bacterium]
MTKTKPGTTLIIIAMLVGLLVQALPASAATMTLMSPIPTPDVTAASVYVMDTTSGIPLYSKNPDDRRAIGSMVKMMTALVTLKWVEDPDNALVTITDYDPVELGYTQMYLQVGDTLSVTQLLYGLMLPSGGDAANALCRYVGGIISGVTEHPGIACESFVGEMNKYAAELGLDNSRFTNPDGRDADNAYSSAQDVYLMTEAMMQNSKLMGIIQHPAYLIYSEGDPSLEYRADSTLAPYLGSAATGIPGVIGGKTGSEVQAGANASVIREVNGGQNRVIIVVMGSDLVYNDAGGIDVDTRWDDVRTIVSAMDSQFAWTNPADPGVIPGLSSELMVWDVQFENPPAIPVPTSGDAGIAYQMQVGALTKTGEPAGTLFLFFGTTPVGQLPLYQAEIASQ